jgi:hypothetical protein
MNHKLLEELTAVVEKHTTVDSRKAEVISEYCKLSEEVGRYFHSEYAYDCFCMANIRQSSSYQYDERILFFIRAAVAEKIEREGVNGRHGRHDWSTSDHCLKCGAELTLE